MSGRIIHDAVRLVGREAELRALTSGLDGAARGSAHLILVRGPAGSGKTVLLDALERRARRAGATVLRGSCSPDEARRPWHAARSLFGDPPPPAGHAAVPPSHRLLRRVTEAAESGPVTVMLDDAQWCDAESLAWLDLLMNRGHRLPLLVLLARRRSGLAGSPRAVPDAGGIVDLGPLTERDAGELARRWWDSAPEKPFVHACHRVCRGNPSLLARLFARLRDEGAPADAGGAPRARVLGGEIFAGHLLATLDRQPDHVRRVVEALSVLGQADEELVGMLCGVPEPLVAGVAGVLRDEEVIDAELAELLDDDLRARVLGAMPPDALDRWRSRAARLLNDAGRPIEEISAQLVRLPRLSEPWMRDVLREAARLAERDGASGTAMRYLSRMSTLDPGDRGAQAEFARLIGRDDPVGAAPPPGRDGPGPCGDHRLRKVVESGLWLIGVRRGSSMAIFDRVLAMGMSQAYDEGDRVRAAQSMVSALSGSSSQDCAALARRVLSGAEDNWALSPAAYVLSLADEVEDAVRAMDRMIARATDRGDDLARVTALTTRSLIRGESGDVEGALADATSAVALVGRRSWAAGVAAPRTALAAVLAQRGHAGGAAAVLDRRIPLEPARSGHDCPWALMTRARLAAARGDLEGVLSSLTTCGALLAEAGVENPRFAPWWVGAAFALAGLGRRNEAEEIVEHGERLAATWASASARGLALLARGAITEGGAGVETLAESVATLAGTPARWYLVRAEILLGEALLRMGDREGARGHFRQAVYVSARSGFRGVAGKARERLVAAGGWMYHGDGGVEDVLTTAERRVAELAVTGATNREIARTLRIAVRTVEIHLTSVFRKLDVSGRTDLGAALGASGSTGRRAPRQGRGAPAAGGGGGGGSGRGGDN